MHPASDDFCFAQGKALARWFRIACTVSLLLGGTIVPMIDTGIALLRRARTERATTPVGAR